LVKKERERDWLEDVNLARKKRKEKKRKERKEEEMVKREEKSYV
jgi:hypothetical protein